MFWKWDRRIKLRKIIDFEKKKKKSKRLILITFVGKTKVIIRVLLCNLRLHAKSSRWTTTLNTCCSINCTPVCSFCISEKIALTVKVRWLVSDKLFLKKDRVQFYKVTKLYKCLSSHLLSSWIKIYCDLSFLLYSWETDYENHLE